MRLEVEGVTAQSDSHEATVRGEGRTLWSPCVSRNTGRERTRVPGVGVGVGPGAEGVKAV